MVLEDTSPAPPPSADFYGYTGRLRWRGVGRGRREGRERESPSTDSGRQKALNVSRY